MRWKITLGCCVLAARLVAPVAAWAQGGPPFLTNDPGTPGNANWEINLGYMPTLIRGASSYQLPQVDLNFGLGDRIQLTYEVPYVVQSNQGRPAQGGWSNGYPGVKWRFVDGGEGGWQVSSFPQLQTGVSTLAQQRGIGGPGPRYLLPFEASKTIGPLDFDVEAGYYFPIHGPRERFFGFATGRSLTARLELDAEVYDDRAYGALPHAITLDIGGRYKLHQGFIALFMLGRSINGFASEQPEFQGYVGVQILLSDYGRTLTAEP